MIRYSITRMGGAIIASVLLVGAAGGNAYADHEPSHRGDKAERGGETLLAAAHESKGGKNKGDILVRLRGLAFLTDTKGTTDALGGSARTSDDYIPELDFTYFFTKNIAAELILGYTQHSLEVKNSTAGNLDLGSTKLLPPVLSLQYHFLPDAQISPYLGVGLHYSIFFDTEKGRSVNSVKLTNGFGYAFQAGVDYMLNDRWSLNLDVKKVFVDTDIKVNGGAINAKNTDLDPWVIGIGTGYRF